MKILGLLLLFLHATHLEYLSDSKRTTLSVLPHHYGMAEKSPDRALCRKSYSSYIQLASSFALDFSNDCSNDIAISQLHSMIGTIPPGTDSMERFNAHQSGGKHTIVVYGGISRMDTTKKEIYLVFTGHEFADGGEIILKTLKKQSIKASFFFTGDFYRTEKFVSLIKRLKENGHYLGAHSDRHLLYAPWERRDSLLIDKTIFTEDLNNNYKELKKFGISSSDAHFFLPPYEWYNQTISQWTNELGLELVNFTGGTSSNADYTTPDMPNYISSDTIFNRILRYESTSSNGLNGFLLLTHFGTHELRTDKFYNKLDGLITELKRRGYSFKRL